jgi:beta-galactosidase
MAARRRNRRPVRRRTPPSRRTSPLAELVPGGIRVGSETVPLLAGSVHYWRLERDAWRPALQAVASLGLRLVDTYVPWGIHERAPGEYDFGSHDPKLDVAELMRLCKELGLWCIIRPGPHVNAELTWFGLPERVIWDANCQARSAGDRPVALPVVPLAFPVPSYASEAFHTEVASWFGAVAGVLAPWCFPDGPIVLVQIDNEGAMYFRDGVYDQDYHPDAIAAFRRFVQRRYRRVDALRAAYAEPELTFSRVEPPRSFDAETALDVTRHLDWAEYQEELLASALTRMRNTLEAAGLRGIPTSHNLPLGESVTPLDPGKIGACVELVGLDYYHAATAPQRAMIARRTSELALRSEARQTPAFACELGAGFPPFFPPLTERDNEFTALCALAYGLRGYNVYMAIERDRWIGAPFDARARERPSAEFWRRLSAALERTRFFELRRRAAVHLVVPRSFRRLSRILHAFGPLSPALFHVLGGGAEQACYEDELGLGAPVVLELERFLRSLEAELDRRRIPHATASGDLIDDCIRQAQWTVVACPGALEDTLLSAARAALRDGHALTVAPFAPLRDGSFQPRPSPVELWTKQTRVPATSSGEPDAIRALVEQAANALDLPTLPAAPEDIFVTVHENDQGRQTVLFVINPTPRPIESQVTAAGAHTAVDLLDGLEVTAQSDRLRLVMPPHSVRMLELGAP